MFWDSLYALFLDVSVGVMTRRQIQYNLENENDIYVLKFVKNFNDMLGNYKAALDNFLEAENDSAIVG